VKLDDRSSRGAVKRLMTRAVRRNTPATRPKGARRDPSDVPPPRKRAARHLERRTIRLVHVPRESVAEVEAEHLPRSRAGAKAAAAGESPRRPREPSKRGVACGGRLIPSDDGGWLYRRRKGAGRLESASEQHALELPGALCASAVIRPIRWKALRAAPSSRSNRRGERTTLAMR
jgi:hypothetical protein